MFHSHQNQKTIGVLHLLQNFELGHQNRLLDGCSSVLKFFLEKHVYEILWSSDIAFGLRIL